MNLKLKILIVSESHISGSLVSMQLQKMGYESHIVHSGAEALDVLHNGDFSVIIAENFDGIEAVERKSAELTKPMIFLDTPKVADKQPVLKLSFKEEDLLHKISLLTDSIENKEELEFIDAVVRHYSGDKALAYKVCQAFLDVWQKDIEIVQNSFVDDSDKALEKKIHSFKGVLSAIGSTEASKTIKKMEILVKGKQRKLAESLLPGLLDQCQDISKELGDLSALAN